MPVVRYVTEEEIQLAADEGGFVVSFHACLRPNKTAFVVKSQLVVTYTKSKGERVEEVVEHKPNDCEPFRVIVCGLYGDRKGFVWTNGQNMYDGQGEVIEAKQERAPKVLTKDHLAALQEGRKRAREAAKQMPETPAPKVVTIESDGNALFKAGFYSSPCRTCGKGISRTGRKGRAPTTHKAAKETCPT